jgi:hypothetical protein
MPIEYLSPGTTTIMKTNVVYALPAVQVRLYCANALGVFELSNDAGFIENTGATKTDGTFLAVGKFVRNTGPDVAVTCKRD